jgi:hypothetical protein
MSNERVRYNVRGIDPDLIAQMDEVRAKLRRKFKIRKTQGEFINEAIRREIACYKSGLTRGS